MRISRAALRLIRRRWAYTLVVAPVLTDWIDTGHWPTAPREYVTELVLGAVLLVCARILHREADTLRRLAETDALTGVLNRLRFERDLAEALTDRRGSLAVAYVDVNDFKRINDRHGHAAGDDVLRAVASALTTCFRQREDRVYRIGGDEFAVLVHAPAREVWSRLSALTTQRQVETPAGEAVSISVGVVDAQPGEQPTALVSRADLAMYERKRRRASSEPGQARRWPIS